ncbi:hypothetical protein ACOMHN_063292 [Nucella lapillus]
MSTHHMCCVHSHTQRKTTNLVNVYYPNGSNSEADVEWLYNLETNQNSWVVAGDFNVCHKLWDTGQTKDSGDHLANTIPTRDWSFSTTGPSPESANLGREAQP